MRLSGSTKFLLFAIALLIAVAGYLAVEHLRTQAPAPGPVAGAPSPATPAPASAPATAGQTTTTTPPQPESPAVSDAELVRFYGECTSGNFPTIANAQTRAAACSRALQTRRLKPDEIAFARLVRGIARTAMGDRELASQDYIEAVKRYDSLIDPANPDSLALYRRAVALEGTGQTDKALEDYTAAIKGDPQASFAFLGRGVLLATRQRAYNRAIQDFDRVLVIEPDNVDALIARGDAFSQLDNPGRALADLNRAVALAPANATAYLARGLAENRRGDRTAAMRDYEAALKHDPRKVDALVNIGALQLLDGKPEAAVATLDRAIAIDPKYALAVYNRGFAYFSLKQYDKAIADYSTAIALNPGMGLAYNNLGLTRAIVGTDLKQALTDSDQALKLLPLNIEVRDTRGFIYLKLGEPALALKEYDAALTIDPNRAVSLYGRGLARIRMGDSAGKSDQQAALTINPEVANEFAVYGLQ